MPGIVLSQPHMRDHRVERVGAHEKLDRIGDHFARDQRSLHPLGAHGDPVGNGDGVELDRSATRGANACFHALGQLPQMKIAGSDFRPGIGHGDERASEVVVGEPGGFQHRPCRGASEPFFYDVTLHDDLGSPLEPINQKSPATVVRVRGAAPSSSLGGWPAPDNYYDQNIHCFFHGLVFRRTPLRCLRRSRSVADPRQRKKTRCKGQ